MPRIQPPSPLTSSTPLGATVAVAVQMSAESPVVPCPAAAGNPSCISPSSQPQPPSMCSLSDYAVPQPRLLFVRGAVAPASSLASVHPIRSLSAPSRGLFPLTPIPDLHS